MFFCWSFEVKTKKIITNTIDWSFLVLSSKIHANHKRIYANDTHQSVHVDAFYDALVDGCFWTQKMNFPTELSRLPASDDLNFTTAVSKNSNQIDPFVVAKMFMLICYENLHNLMNFEDSVGKRRKTFVWCFWHWSINRFVEIYFNFVNFIVGAFLSSGDVTSARNLTSVNSAQFCF